MSDIRSVHYAGMHSANGDQINSRAVSATIERHHLQAMHLVEGRDDLGRVQLTARSTHLSGDEKVALYMQTNFFSDGIRYKSYLGVSAFGFCDDQDRGEAEGMARDEVERPLHRLPGADASLPERIYLGDINGDQLPDLLVVMENGAGLVMYQEPA